LRRQTVHNHLSSSTLSRDMSSLGLVSESAEDHIYEEIAEVDTENDISEKENEEMSFISLISIERRKNLRFYGSTGWDFGTEMS
jgi:arginine repressor